ncbi:hypothetical protein AAF712_009904 [Marasmius tenuissimus]|uniref:Uncharacterized protein n=1 Tax=Marasmius tenuissimus TaxID=585030 RepID=A0ABR2ZNS6_9AGAR
MVRPRKYKTKAQQRQAVLEKSRRSYNKHRERILMRKQTKRNKVKTTQGQVLVMELLGSMHQISKDELDKDDQKRARRYFESLLDGYRAELSRTFTSDPLGFYASLYHRTIIWLDGGSSGTSPFSQLESQIQKLDTTLTLHMRKIQNLFSDQTLYQRYASLQELVQEHIACIDELEYGQLVDGLMDKEQLYEKHRDQRCVYQNISCVPYLSGTKAPL